MIQENKKRYTTPMLEALRLNYLNLLATLSMESSAIEDLYPHDKDWQDYED